MRVFSQKGIRIDQLALEAKIIYMAFCVFALAALAVSALYYYDLVGASATKGVKAYYAGEAEAVPPAVDEGGGPAIELPEDSSPPAPLIVRASWRKLLEATHFHLFTVPVFLLIIAHLFMLCRLPPLFRAAAIVSGVLSAGVHMAAPWVIFYGGGGWAWLMPVTGVWMTLSMLILCGVPMVMMWREPAATPSGSEPQ
jgi:hypothetical protein